MQVFRLNRTYSLQGCLVFLDSFSFPILINGLLYDTRSSGCLFSNVCVLCRNILTNLFEPAVKAQTRLRGCAISSEHSLLTYAISAQITCTSSLILYKQLIFSQFAICCFKLSQTSTCGHQKVSLVCVSSIATQQRNNI